MTDLVQHVAPPTLTGAAVAAPELSVPGPSADGTRARRRRRRSRELPFLLALLALLVLVAVFPGLAATHDPLALDGMPFRPPSGSFWFGTDEIGRDLWSRVMYGLRISFFSAALAVAVALVLGTIVGIASGVRPGGVLDRLLSILTEAVMAVPAVLLALAAITAYGRGAYIAAVAIGVAEATGFARLVRGLVIQAQNLGYVEAARSCGTRPWRVLTRHVVPAIYPPVLSYTAMHFGLAMLAIGSLSYLGFGEAPPSPEWGVLISGGQKYLVHAWWVAIIPGIALTAVVVLLNRIAFLLQENQS